MQNHTSTTKCSNIWQSPETTLCWCHDSPVPWQHCFFQPTLGFEPPTLSSTAWILSLDVFTEFAMSWRAGLAGGSLLQDWVGCPTMIVNLPHKKEISDWKTRVDRAWEALTSHSLTMFIRRNKWKLAQWTRRKKTSRFKGCEGDSANHSRMRRMCQSRKELSIAANEVPRPRSINATGRTV